MGYGASLDKVKVNQEIDFQDAAIKNGDGTDISAALNFTAGTAAASEILAVDASKDITGLRDVTVRHLNRTAVQTVDMNDSGVTLTAATLTSDVLFVDPEGNTEILKLPPEADSEGVSIVIHNTGGESITVQNDAAGALKTIATTESGIFSCDGTTWYGGVMV